ncbi:MAG: hypothetical protein P4L62_05000 [Candidatus Pacebacteria bacterium]|nr:hypothetical protein [Candidatus Paceibacterota bacterium]MDR3583677.1 hypothetical protein [Candidatus Paceibacterota bacterium]
MKFFEFEKKMLKYPIFTSKEVRNIFFNEPAILVQIAFWSKKGYLKKIKKGLYAMANTQNNINPMELAEKIYAPSYLSLEFMLHHYGIIPDVPGTFTSVTSRKTMFYKTDFGNFSYQKIKPEFFFGYIRQDNAGMAAPEKALFDYLYLNKKKFEAEENFWREMRIDEDFKFDRKKIEAYKKIFNDKKINNLIDSLLAYQKNA